MTPQNDTSRKNLLVRFKDSDNQAFIGTGIIYAHPSLKNTAYILTAAHNLFADKDNFTLPRIRITLEIWNPTHKQYQQQEIATAKALVSSTEEKDAAIFVLERTELERITGILPTITALQQTGIASDYLINGFAKATNGQEPIMLHPTWLDIGPDSERFQLQLNQDYTGHQIGGLSGSGVFINATDGLHLFGIFTRFREEKKGKVLYCQSLITFNELLKNRYLPLIRFSYVSEYGLNPQFFSNHVETAIHDLKPRYNENINVALPISLLFHDIVKDDLFRGRLLLAFDKWLIGATSIVGAQQRDLLKDFESKVAIIVELVQTNLLQIKRNAEQAIDLGVVEQEIIKLQETALSELSKLYDLQYEVKKKQTETESLSSISPYHSEIKRVMDILDLGIDLIKAIKKINIALSNYPVLLINGEAGSGKSHLLGDAAVKRIKNGLPAILLLGQHFRKENTVWQNILTKLNLNCTNNQFLETINNIGKQTGSRIPIIIDALNEGGGKSIWSTELAGLIADIRRYPYVALVISVRDTYYNSIIPVSVQNSKDVTYVSHEGFSGNEYQAVKQFCEFYGLIEPNFPMLTSEFSNPLFLQLICESLVHAGIKQFEPGIRGVTYLFESYIDSVHHRLSKKREEYDNRKSYIKKSIALFAKMRFDSAGEGIKLEDALKMFEDNFPSLPHLMDDLVQENVLIESRQKDYGTGVYEDFLDLSYDRLGDFYVCEELLAKYKDINEVKTGFEESGVLGQSLNEQNYLYNEGLMEMMAILLPERFDVEIYEVLYWVFKKEESLLDGTNHLEKTIIYKLLNSLKWRIPEKIDGDKISSWFQTNDVSIDYSVSISYLITLTGINKHPFNADHLFAMFGSYPMPERDAIITDYLQSLNIYGESSDSPLERLIQWAWTPGISPKVDHETARLIGTTLTWFLSTSNRGIRDRVTKAMVNLLEQQPDVLIAIMERYCQIDDVYILERLYGVTYGCILRTDAIASVKLIAEYVYNKVFKDGNPPAHILLRDYARNTVEYAITKNLGLKVNLKSLRPPYRSIMPQTFPKVFELPKYKAGDVGSRDYKYYHDRIASSVLHNDFGIYIIDSSLQDFEPISFNTIKRAKLFFRSLPHETKHQLHVFRKHCFLHKNEIEQQHINLTTGEDISSKITSISKALLEKYAHLKTVLSPEQWTEFNSCLITYWMYTLKADNGSKPLFQPHHIKCWIVDRVFKLGYDANLHGQYEKNLSSGSRFGNKEERIGKKYQWIAFHEIIAMISDNYKVKSDYYQRPPVYYQGAWKDYLRDIDPAFTTRKVGDAEDVEELDMLSELTHGLQNNEYSHWYIQTPKWLQMSEDLPNPGEVVGFKDDVEWLYLNVSRNWREPKKLGVKAYDLARKDIWYNLQAYLIPLATKSNTIKWFQKQNFYEERMPENESAYVSLINREHYWSPLSKDSYHESLKWINKGKLNIMVASAEAVGEMSQDSSGAHFKYSIPTKTLFEGMGLKYGAVDGTLTNYQGQIIVGNDENGVFIQKQHLLDFLSKQGLDIIWALKGEKRLMGGPMTDNPGISMLSGVCYLDESKLQHSLTLMRHSINQE